MKLYISDKAVEQMAEDTAKMRGEQDASQAVEKIERKKVREAARKAKLETKARKVAARNAAYQADANLEQNLASVLDVEIRIEQAENRLEKDRDVHRIRVEREQNTVDNLLRKMANLKAELLDAESKLVEVKADVPASIAGMDGLQTERDAKIEELRSTFQTTEEAWKNPDLTNSAKSKRKRKLRRAVKTRLGSQEP